jgi:molybdopterin-guanine dinucleotide biosynthesis protein A
MLPRMVRLLGEVVNPVVVVAAPGQDLPALPDSVPIIRDAIEGRGPLQGLAAGLQALIGQAGAAFVTSCDSPFLRPAFAKRVLDLMGDDSIAVPFVGGRHHPLAAAYRVDLLPEVHKLLAEDRLRTSLLLESVSTRLIEARELEDVDPALESLRNLNTPEEYQAALRRLAYRPYNSTD